MTSKSGSANDRFEASYISVGSFSSNIYAAMFSISFLDVLTGGGRWISVHIGLGRFKCLGFLFILICDCLLKPKVAVTISMEVVPFYLV